ncbi:MAG: hypothetical protein FJ363_01915 [Gemmatimonadetes bacterium]|nr:hypothetical protein [Gemmatimonadota bacterium]
MRPRRFVPLAFVAISMLVGCNPAEQKTADLGVAAAPAADLPPFQQELPSLKAEATLPGVWKSAYGVIPRPDTVLGSHHAVEFHYTADSAIGVPPRLLMVIRVFKKATWNTLTSVQKEQVRFITEHSGEVFAFSVVTSSPYPVNSASTLRVDQMMLQLLAETSPFRLTFKP